MASKLFKLSLATIFLVFILSVCQFIKGLLGAKDDVLDFPPGEYIGKAKLIGEKASDATATENGAAESTEPKPTTEAAKTTKPEAVATKETAPAKTAEKETAKADEKKEAGKEGETKPAEGAELKEPETAVDTGVLQAQPVLVNPMANIPGVDVRITFLPKEKGLTDGIGILFINETSHRFIWRTNGNNKDTWNILFTKDNNVYSNLQLNFNFDGVLTASNVENKLIGRLYIDNDSKISEYYIEAYQTSKPKILPPKEALAIKGGDDIVIDVEKVGENPEEIRAILTGIPSEKQAASINELKVKNIEYDPKKGIYKVYIMTAKTLGKGEYTLYLIRSNAYKSNSIPIKV